MFGFTIIAPEIYVRISLCSSFFPSKSQIIIFQTFLIRMLVHQPDHHPDYFQSGLIDTTFYYIPRLENYLLNFHQYLILRHQDQQ